MEFTLQIDTHWCWIKENTLKSKLDACVNNTKGASEFETQSENLTSCFLTNALYTVSQQMLQKVQHAEYPGPSHLSTL